ncbi:MAG: recombinase family protein [Actinomycetota bacterium]
MALARKRYGSDSPASYIRVSRERDGMASPDIYRGQVASYCEARGMSLPTETNGREFSDIGISGARVDNRPGLLRLIERRQEFSTLIVPKVTRFSRSTADLINLTLDFGRDGVGIVFLDAPELDTNTPHGELMLTMMAGLANYERRLIGERWKDTIAYLRRNGRLRGGGSTPYGYDWVSKEAVANGLDEREPGLYVNPDEALVVQEVFKRFLSGDRASVLAVELTRRGVPTKAGGQRWTPKKVADMVVNPTYIGVIEDDGHVIEGTWEPIVERDTFDKARALKLARTAEWNAGARLGNGQQTVSLLSGLLRCDSCGAPYRRSSGGHSRPTFWFCRNRAWNVRAEGGERCDGVAIYESVAEQQLVDAFFERVADLYRTHATKKLDRRTIEMMVPSIRDDSEARLDALRRRMERLLDAYISGTLFEDVYRAKADDLERERDQLERSIADRVAQANAVERSVQDIENFIRRAADLESVWKRATVAERNGLLKIAIKAARPQGKPRRPKTTAIEWADWLDQR